MLKFFAVVLLATAQVLGYSCTCGTATYANAHITTAVSVGNSVNPSPTETKGPYPHLFNNGERLAFPFCSGQRGDWVEYPLQTGAPYRGGRPGADRVVYLRGTNTFCGCMTHTGARTSTGFVLCGNRR